MAVHTPTPWRFSPWHVEEGPSAVRAPEGWIVCTTSSDDDAEFIVEACNAFDTLNSRIAALEAENAALRSAHGATSRQRRRIRRAAKFDVEKAANAISQKLVIAKAQIVRLKAEKEDLVRALTANWEQFVRARIDAYFSPHQPKDKGEGK